MSIVCRYDITKQVEAAVALHLSRQPRIRPPNNTAVHRIIHDLVQRYIDETNSLARDPADLPPAKVRKCQNQEAYNLGSTAKKLAGDYTKIYLNNVYFQLPLEGLPYQFTLDAFPASFENKRTLLFNLLITNNADSLVNEERFFSFYAKYLRSLNHHALSHISNELLSCYRKGNKRAGRAFLLLIKTVSKSSFAIPEMISSTTIDKILYHQLSLKNSTVQEPVQLINCLLLDSGLKTGPFKCKYGQRLFLFALHHFTHVPMKKWPGKTWCISKCTDYVTADLTFRISCALRESDDLATKDHWRLAEQRYAQMNKSSIMSHGDFPNWPPFKVM